jgi:shikimate 5-dehydrogenase
MKHGFLGVGVVGTGSQSVDEAQASDIRCSRVTMKKQFPAAEKPTMYFIGVTTSKSSINKIFPLWAERLELGSCQLKGIDFQLHDKPELYREAVEFIKSDPLSRGALVTTHKMDLYDACRDIFDALDPLSDSTEEVSSIYKRGDKLHARAVDPISSGLALQAFLPRDHWKATNAEAYILGAGGSAVALTWYLVQLRHGANRPSKVHVANLGRPRLDHLRELHASWKSGVPLECHLTSQPESADTILESLKPSSLVVNATGLGKDAPGSPITDSAKFPPNALVWEFNYRGDLVFLRQAEAQKAAKNLTIEDGWIYFVHGWTRGIADVFDVDIPTQGSAFDDLARIAASVR